MISDSDFDVFENLPEVPNQSNTFNGVEIPYTYYPRDIKKTAHSSVCLYHDISCVTCKPFYDMGLKAPKNIRKQLERGEHCHPVPTDPEVEARLAREEQENKQAKETGPQPPPEQEPADQQTDDAITIEWAKAARIWLADHGMLAPPMKQLLRMIADRNKWLVRCNYNIPKVPEWMKHPNDGSFRMVLLETEQECLRPPLVSREHMYDMQVDEQDARAILQNEDAAATFKRLKEEVAAALEGRVSGPESNVVKSGPDIPGHCAVDLQALQERWEADRDRYFIREWKHLRTGDYQVVWDFDNHGERYDDGNSSEDSLESRTSEP